MTFTNLEKSDMVWIYDEARGHSELAQQIYRERFPQKILLNARTFVNVVQHFRDIGHFEVKKREFGRQREHHILVAEEVLHEIVNQLRTSTRRLANHLGVYQFEVWLRVEHTQEIRQNRGILNRVGLSWARGAEACITNDDTHFEHLL
jgi:hypothetical protein